MLDLENLHEQEHALSQKNAELEKYGRWTLNYVRIEKSLEKIVSNKIGEITQKKLTERLWQISETYGIDPLLILAVVNQESRGNPEVRGRYRSGAESGAYGLMQLKLETAATLGKKLGIYHLTEEDLFRPEINLVLGTAYLARLIGRYGNVKHALIAYNVGPGRVDRLLANGQNLPMSYYEGVYSKYRALAADSIFLNLVR